MLRCGWPQVLHMLTLIATSPVKENDNLRPAT